MRLFYSVWIIDLKIKVFFLVCLFVCLFVVVVVFEWWWGVDGGWGRVEVAYVFFSFLFAPLFFLF